MKIILIILMLLNLFVLFVCFFIGIIILFLWTNYFLFILIRWIQNKGKEFGKDISALNILINEEEEELR